MEGQFGAVPACVNRTHPLSDGTPRVAGGFVLRLSCFGWRGGPEDRFIFAAIFFQASFRTHTIYDNHELPVPFEFEVRYRRRCRDTPHFCKEFPRK
ncbi:hypothetical protein B2M20_04560 [Nitrobacter vulgaris]|uniref:Uncharacterized protein n=1 Tax=Nitrobacter vulgaris TaxID=29421 RepID=A0A1V4I1D3_NITVU|nr:hypothetical protein B2M20_04560 [Nitrobacter vulgaris]